MPYKNLEDRRACSARHYHANKKVYQDRARAFRKVYRPIIRAFVDWLREQPCTECKLTFPIVCMDFDHLRDKAFNISSINSTNMWISQERLWEEIQKCEVVCSNCHRIRTRDRRLA